MINRRKKVVNYNKYMTLHISDEQTESYKIISKKLGYKFYQAWVRDVLDDYVKNFNNVEETENKRREKFINSVY